ncbi:MAG: single-stranded-DNA-specific exonuclease RecJ [Opitutae bacterium]
MKHWIEQQADQKSVDLLKRKIGVSSFLANLLVQRGIKDPVLAQQFLKPKLRHLDDPFRIKNMDLAVSRILQAREKEERILVVGDYDVDGITSTVMTKQALESLDLVVETVIPKRLSEGYGLTKEVLERGLKNGKFGLVIALDCGTNSVKEADFLKKYGIDLIVVDHHQLKAGVLPDAILINPHLQQEQGEPWRYLCTAGLCFKLIHALFKRVRKLDLSQFKDFSPRDFLPLCAIGTLADLVSLQGESRIFSHFGIKRLFIDASPGLIALLKECGLDKTIEPETEDITYKLAPRINACGRLNEPEIAVNLLLEKNAANCRDLAKKLTEFNDKRKGIEAQLTADALAQAEEIFADRAAVVVTGDGYGWHPGVVGIVAGKLASSLNKPCLVLARSEDGEYCGSGRGVPGINLVDILSACQDKLSHWGGHPAAVGLGLQEKNLDGFISQFLETVDKNSLELDQDFPLPIHALVKKSELRFELLDELNELGPFGQDNPEPILGVKEIVLDSPPRRIGNGEHFQFSFDNGTSYIRGIAWRMGDDIPPHSEKLDLAFKLRKNYWNGNYSLQLVLEDWKLSELS